MLISLWPPPTADDINALLDNYEAQKRSPVTASEYRTRIGAFCKWAMQYGHLNINPMDWGPPRKMSNPIPESFVRRTLFR